MDLDPRLRSKQAHAGLVSSTSTPSGRLVEENAAADSPHRGDGVGANGSDSPSRGVARTSPNRQEQQRQRQQKLHEHDAEHEHDAGHDAGHDAAAHAAAHAAAAAEAKKSRACEACRVLKVRCEPDPSNEGAPCRRCKKAGRSCVVTVPTRKRQKKTDSRVSELEKRIDALTASLQARVAVPAAGLGLGLGVALGSGADGGTGQGGAGAGAERQARMSASEAVTPGLWNNNHDVSAAAARSCDARGMTASPNQQNQNAQPAGRSSVFEMPDAAAAGHKRKATTTSDYRDAPMDENRASPATVAGPWPSPLPAAAAAATGGAGLGGRGQQRCDIIDRGIITMERAAALFQRYKQDMLHHLPAVVFPSSMTLMQLRRSKPYLFLAVMAAASSETVGVQHMLQRELMELFAEKIVIVGEKNLELIQALQVAVIWYWPPEHFEELKFYQLVHMAAVMALDIGLGTNRTSKTMKQRTLCPPAMPPAMPSAMPSSFMTWRDHPFRRHPQPDPTSLESRRAWLTCHFLAANTAMSLHRPHLIRWSPFMTESLEMLRSGTSPGASPTDPYFCHLIWTHRMVENIGVQLSMDDADAAVNIEDAKTQATLRKLERELEGYIGGVPREMMQPTLRMGFCILNLYMHELALHSDSNTSNINSNQEGSVESTTATTKNEPVSAAHINALSACLSAIDDTFQTFLAMDVRSIRCLPVFTFVRVAYAVVILMKMYFSASNPSSELGRVINKDHIRVAYYLEALLDKFNATAADEKCRPASKFLLVLVMLRTWFIKHGKGEARMETPLGRESPSSGAGAGATPVRQHDARQQQQQQQHQQHHQHNPQHQLHQQSPSAHTANTPLQVLSEVAMGREPTPLPSYNSPHSTSQPTPPPPPHRSASATSAAVPAPPLPSMGLVSHPNPPYYQDAPVLSTMSPQPQQWMTQPPRPVSVAVPVPVSVPGAVPVPVPVPDMTIGFPPDFDFEGLGVPLDGSGEMYDGGAKMVMNDPLFSGMFQGLPDPNFFDF
ncbi:hypothetical protein E4U55_005900 [Claviceps digitariae]|nr:hypothetical protein E4U55_005900 [Claviceps digitariae]